MRWLRYALWPAGLAFGVAAEWVGRPDLIALDAAAGFALVFLGLVAWSRRPGSRAGPIMSAAGLAWFLGTLWALAVFLHRGPLAQLLISYPGGRLSSRLQRVGAGAAYAYAAADAVAGNNYATIIFALGLVALSARRYVGATGTERRIKVAGLRSRRRCGSQSQHQRSARHRGNSHRVRGSDQGSDRAAVEHFVSMSVAIISGSAGLIGSEAAVFFAESRGLDVVGIDNDMRRRFFGDDASTSANLARLQQRLGKKYTHFHADIRDQLAISKIFGKYGRDVSLVVHAAAQPSHDWAATDPSTDFTVNANGTAVMLEASRHSSPDAVFIFTSTNKVYGDTPNRLPLIELEKRWEIEPTHSYANGIREDMSIDSTLHSLFGASKVAADILVQEYGRYFGMRTACFRGGCLTGPNHAGTALHAAGAAMDW